MYWPSQSKVEYPPRTDRQRIERLATYNGERQRGIVHTAEWQKFMRSEQAWFDARALASCT